MYRKISIYCDGGARGNPGPAAGAFVVYDNKIEIDKGSIYMEHATNNVAEYEAILLAIKWLLKNKSDITQDDVVIILDSQLASRQLMGVYKIKNERLKNYASEIKRLEANLSFNVRYDHVLRDKNKRADQLVNETIDLHTV